MGKRKLKANVVFEEEDYFNWIILAEINYEVLPVGNEYGVLEFNSKEEADLWVKRHSNQFVLVEE